MILNNSLHKMHNGQGKKTRNSVQNSNNTWFNIKKK